jgi:hypothetical protein
MVILTPATHYPQEESFYLFQPTVQLKVIRLTEKSSDIIGNRRIDFSACSVVPQPTTLQRALYKVCMKHVLYIGITGKATERNFDVMSQSFKHA